MLLDTFVSYYVPWWDGTSGRSHKHNRLEAFGGGGHDDEDASFFRSFLTMMKN
jgi:hypothetical protein